MHRICTLLRWSIPALVLSAGLATAAVAQKPPVLAGQPSFNFGKVLRGAALEHTFTIVNDSGSPLYVKRVRLTPPLLPVHLPKQIPAGGQAEVRVKLDTKDVGGLYEGSVLLSFDDPKIDDVELTVTGRVILPLEADPPVIVLTAQRGEKAEASVEIINHDAEPVIIDPPIYLPSHFTMRLETLEPGRRYRLTLVMDPNGPAEKNKQTILLKTNSKIARELTIAAYTYLHERVYTFPDIVELGGLRLEDIRRGPDLVKRTAQTLMVYRKGTADFQAKFSTDIPQMVIGAERGPMGDRYQLTVSLAPGKLEAGTIRGNIFIDTNDKEFPRLTVPVVGEIIGPAERPEHRK